jgi:hypothetical protein
VIDNQTHAPGETPARAFSDEVLDAQRSLDEISLRLAMCLDRHPSEGDTRPPSPWDEPGVFSRMLGAMGADIPDEGEAVTVTEEMVAVYMLTTFKVDEGEDLARGSVCPFTAEDADRMIRWGSARDATEEDLRRFNEWAGSEASSETGPACGS